MTVDTAPALLEAVRDCRLLRPEQLAELTPEVLARCPDSKSLARELFQRGWLTRFQLTWLVNGRGSQLVLGGYHLVDRIGTGGMGEVYKAFQRRLGRVVALKVIRPDLMQNPVQVRRFQHEAQAAARLQHPNIVAVYDFDEANGSHFLAMEFVEGADLGRVVKERGPLPVELACDYVRQAALGLGHAHERGLVHRDIKPANLLVDRSGVVKVLDMGLARSAVGPDEEDDALTKTGTVVGTPDFMAPEQAKNSRTVGPKADLYALGATLYYLLTARPLFEGTSAIEKLLHHQMDPPPALASVRPDAPPALEALLGALLAKNPSDRPSGCEAVAAALAAVVSAPLAPELVAPVAVPLCVEPLPVTAVLGPAMPTAAPFAFDATADLPASRPAAPPASTSRRGTVPFGLLALAAGGLFFLAAVGLAVVLVVTHRSGGEPVEATHPDTPPTRPTGKPGHGGSPRPAELDSPDRYLPDDAGAVVIFNLARALEVPAVRKQLRVPKEAQKFFNDLHFDPVQQAHRYCIALDRRDPRRVVLVVQCDPVDSDFFTALPFLMRAEDFQVAPDRPAHKLYHLPDRERESFLAVLGPRALIVATDAEDARAAVRRETLRPGRKAEFKDTHVAESMPKFRPDLVAWATVSGRQHFEGEAEKFLGEHGFAGAVGSLRLEDGRLLAEGDIVGRPAKVRDLVEAFKSLLSLAAVKEKRMALVSELAREAKIERAIPPRLGHVTVSSELPSDRWGPLLGQLLTGESAE